MVQLILVKVTLHPALHNLTTDSSEWLAKPGRIWPILAVPGRSGIFKLHVCVDLTYAPFGMITAS